MSELDKTIEELEQEVLAELEEDAHTKDPQMKGATPAEKQKKVAGVTPGGGVEDAGKPVVDPMQKDSPVKKTAAGAKEIGGDAQQKGEGAPEKMKKLKAGYHEGYSDEEIRELCHSEDHDCAVVVEHPEWGKGKPVHGSHAIPDADGNVEWYDVQFKHGIEEKVMAEDMKILVSEAHHKNEGMHEPKTKKDLMAAMHKEMAHMKKADLQAAYMGMMKAKEGAHDEDEEQMEQLKKQKAEIDERIKSISVKEDMEVLMGADDSLSEEFKFKAATIFEAAVKSKIRSEIERIDEQVRSEKETEIETFKEDLTEKVDSYLDYVVDEWNKENELAIERGLKGEIAEDFISGLKQLFEDHYIDVPDEKYDVLEAQSDKISELEDRLNEEIEKNLKLRESNSSLVRESVISEVSEDLADTEIEKFKSLTEDVEFNNEDNFRNKLDALKESYFPKTVVEQTATFDDEDGSTAQDIDTTDAMSAYMSAISRNKKASA